MPGAGGQPETHAIGNASKEIPSLTANFISSFYTDPKASLNEKTFRGGKTALQLQWDLPPGPFKKFLDTNDTSKSTLSLNSSYERLQENSGEKGKKADIVLGSAKLQFPLRSGMSFPVSVTFANSAEQVKGNYVVGNFGISFDLDALASLIKANK